MCVLHFVNLSVCVHFGRCQYWNFYSMFPLLLGCSYEKAQWISLLSVAIINHHNRRQLKEERVYFSFWFQKDECQSCWAAWQQEAGAGNWEGTPFFGTTKQREHIGWQGRLTSHNPCAQWHTSSSKATPPKPSQIAQPTLDQMNAGRHFSLLPLHATRMKPSLLQ